MQALPLCELIVDGEVLALRADRAPHAFQETMRRFTTKTDVEPRDGGTCTGEHGGAALDVMRTIKRALDPDNRMNPGKMVQI